LRLASLPKRLVDQRNLVFNFFAKYLLPCSAGLSHLMKRN